MATLNLSSLKFTWRGQWLTATLYKKNDVVQFGNASYLCLQDIPDEWMIVPNTSWSNTNMGAPEIAFRDKRPDLDVQYWRIVVRGNTFKRGWMPHRVYQYGDVVRYGGDLYMFAGQPGQGASATANINGQGQVVSVTVNSGGNGYAYGTTVSIGSDNKSGYGATAYPVITPARRLLVTAATKTNPVRITFSTAHSLTDGTSIVFPDINGMTQLIGQDYYVKSAASNQVDLYWDSALTSTVDGTSFSTFVASSTSGFGHSNPSISSIVITNPGTGYTTAPTVAINPPIVRNTHPEDSTYWIRVFQNPNWDTRRLYAVALPNQQPLGWTRNYGDYPNPQSSDSQCVGWIGADGVPYSTGYQGISNTYNAAGRGNHQRVHSWQPATFTFVDWLRSSDNQTSMSLTGLTASYLPTPDGQAPRCIQWVKTYAQSLFLMNNGEVYYCGYNDGNFPGGNSDNTTRAYTSRCTNNSTTGWLGETLPRSFNQTKIIKVDMPNVGQQSAASVSCYALGADGSLWAWGFNGYGQLGLGQQTPGTVSPYSSVSTPTRIPAVFFDNKRIVDFMCFGNDYASVLALDEDGDLWGWGADYFGELGLGQATYPQTGLSASDTLPNQAQGGAIAYRPIPTRIPFDWKRYGGIKKMAYAHYASTGQRFAIVLTNDGNLFGAGAFHRNVSPLNISHNLTNTFHIVNRWTKYITTGASFRQVENFWVVGDAKAVNIFIREKDTGYTYAAGDNAYYTTSGQNTAAYDWFNSGGGTNPWNMVKGPRNLVMVTMNEASASATTGSPYSYLTVMLLEENGRVWGQGRNNNGSLSVGWTGLARDPAMQNPETGTNYLYQPAKMPSGVRIATIMGQGTGTVDLGSFITDDGQMLISGYDGGADVNVQGSIHTAWYDTNISGQSLSLDRYTMHSLIGD